MSDIQLALIWFGCGVIAATINMVWWFTTIWKGQSLEDQGQDPSQMAEKAKSHLNGAAISLVIGPLALFIMAMSLLLEGLDKLFVHILPGYTWMKEHLPEEEIDTDFP